MSAPVPGNARVAQCGACGAELVFRVGSSLIRVCDHCGFASARADRSVETLGKVADLIPTGARLALGMEGKYEGSHFVLVGRLQLDWGKGVWDEWYVAFDDGRWGWLAEAQGRYYLTFRMSRRPAPEWKVLGPGRHVFLDGLGHFAVTDLKQAKVVGARGELPDGSLSGEEAIRSADLAGRDGSFVTLDYGTRGEVPTIFAGHEVPIAALHLGESFEGPPPLKKVQAEKLTCPTCQAPVEPRVPSQTVRLTCSYCSSLLDVSKGSLRHLASLKRPPLTWEPGRKATFFDRTYLVVGWMLREVTVEGEMYTWEEYLLYDEETAGYRFLLCSDGHWSFVTPVSPAEVEEGYAVATFRHTHFRRFSKQAASVLSVHGEFYWAVQVGEKAMVSDFIAVPEGLSKEMTGDEVNWSHAVYLTPEQVWDAFGSTERPLPPQGVGVLQPFPYAEALKKVTRTCLRAIAAAVVLFIVLAIRSGGTLVLDQPLQGEPAEAARASAGSAIDFSEPFEIDRGHRNLEVRYSSSVSQSWVAVSAALVNETTQEVTEVDLESAYYSGRSSDGAWVEDKRTKKAYISSITPGTYVLRTETHWPSGTPRPESRIQLRLGVARFVHFVLVILGLLALPVGLGIYKLIFEGKRWEQSSQGHS